MAYQTMEQRLARLKAKMPAYAREASERMAKMREKDLELYPEVLSLEWHPKAKRPPPMTWRFVYFIECNEFIKIGYTENWQVRFSALTIATPYTLRVLLILAVESKLNETELLMRFIRDKHKGEWFRKSPELLAFIEEQWG